MNFRTVSDIHASVRRNRHKIPHDIDLVVGVPRSGLLAATAISLSRNLPLTDLNSFLDGRTFDGFSHRDGLGSGRDAKSVLVVDDSVLTGRSIQKAKARIESAGISTKITYAAVYGVTQTHPDVDIVLDICAEPRAFEWNVMNHWAMSLSCVDMDGVICVDPTDYENDDGPRYLEFMRSAPLLATPNHKIHSIVTSRLERYRPQTEDYLSANSIQYGQLIMLDLPSAAERRRLGVHASFKAEVYKGQKDCLLFIESDTYQAERINQLTGKSTLAYQDMIFFGDNISRRTKAAVSAMIPAGAKALLKSAFKR